ncbi:MAG: FtsX-like permease family protein [Methanobacteriota archaeon]|nr:MAG: FtsX-like permease family protein [Euryarchaeota archaeon]
MKRKEIAAIAYKSLKSDAIRSSLTLIGVFLGVLTAVLIIGIGQGLIDQANELFAMFGTDKMIIAPISDISNTFSGFGSLSLSDATELRRFSFVDSVSYGTFSKERIKFENEEIESTIYVTTAAFFSQWKDVYKLERGRFFSDNERYVAVLGGKAAHKLFSKTVYPGKSLTINGRKFRVVGTIKEIGQAFSSSDDEAIFINFKDGPNIGLKKDDISFIGIDLVDGTDTAKAKKEVEEFLARKHGLTVDKKDFTIITQEFFQETTGNILNIIYLGAVAVGLIASLVSAVGIGNTMFTSVLRRKREIGIMRAVGVKQKTILLLFLTEAVLLSLIGSIAGLLVAIAIGIVASSVVPFSISIIQVVVALIIGVVVGVLGGILPARRATKISPLEAIRY